MSRPSRKPLDKDLYADVVAEAKARFDVWPSAYASGWVVKTYKARGGRYGGESKGSRTGLTKWFGESWVDLSRPIHDEDGELVGYEPCGRKKSSDHGDPADYPKCRPAKEAMRMSPAEVKDAIKRKRAAEAKAGRGAKGRGGRGARAPVRVATYRGNPEEDAAWLDRLAPPGRSSAIGPEKGRLKPDGVSKLVSPHGSVRYLYAEGGEVLAGLQVVTLDGVTGEATSVYTLPKARRRGIAEILARAAKKDFKSLGFSEHRTEAGSKWVAAVQGRENPVTTPPVFLDPDCRREPPKSGPFCLRCNKPLKDNQRRVHVFYTYDAERGFFGQFVSLQPPGEPALLGADCARALGLSARRNPAPAPAARSKRVAAVQGRENPYDLEDDPLSDVYVIDTETLEDGTVVKYVESPFPYERKPLAHNDDPKVQAPVNLAYLIGTQRRVTVAGVEKYLAGADEKPPRPGSARMPHILVYETSDGRQYIADGHHRAFAALLRDMETFPAIIQFVRE